MLHPDTGIVFSRIHHQELIDEAQREHVLRGILGPSTSRRLFVAAGRVLERTGERMQSIPASR